MNDAVANLAFFLLEKTGSVCGTWRGQMLAKDQRKLFGRFLGKGTVCIRGIGETVTHTRTAGFGMDWETTADLRWSELEVRS